MAMAYPTPSHPLVSDRTIAKRYRIETVLKQTAHEQSYLAKDLVAGSTVVVRTAPALAAEAVETRLTHEAGILTKITAAHLAPLLDFGKDEDHFYWVRPHIEGQSLASAIQGPLPFEQAIEICR